MNHKHFIFDANFLDKGRSLFNQLVELRKFGDKYQKKLEALRKTIDAFESNLRAFCPIVPGIRHLALVSNADFEAALWILERYIHLNQNAGPWDAHSILRRSNKKTAFMELVTDAALIFKTDPSTLVLNHKTWKLVAHAMIERAEFLLKYMLQLWKKPDDLPERFIKDKLLPHGEYHLKLDLGILGMPEKYTLKDFKLTTIFLCGAVIESEFLPTIFPSLEFLTLEMPLFPILIDGDWITSIQNQRVWWHKLSLSNKTRKIIKSDASSNDSSPASKQDRALLILKDNPNIKVTELADKLGVHRTTVYNWIKDETSHLSKAWKIMSGNKNDLPKGGKYEDEDGSSDIEAYDSDSPDPALDSV